MSDKKIGLVLAGGGIKGAAHIGVLKALEEHNIKIDIITGTSIGSIVASTYAMGYKAEDILKLFNHFAGNILKADSKYFLSTLKNEKRIIGFGALSGEKIEEAIRKCATEKDISKIKDIKMPISIPTVDLVNNQEYVFTNREINNQEFIQNLKKQEGDVNYIDNIEVGKAVRASASYPGMFAPCEIGEHKFIDGGILDNVPAKEAKKLGADKILVVKFPPIISDNSRRFYDVVFKSIEIMSNQMDKSQAGISDYILDIYLKSSTIFDMKKIDYCYEQGYTNTIAKIDEIKKTLEI